MFTNYLNINNLIMCKSGQQNRFPGGVSQPLTDLCLSDDFKASNELLIANVPFVDLSYSVVKRSLMFPS